MPVVPNKFTELIYQSRRIRRSGPIIVITLWRRDSVYTDFGALEIIYLLTHLPRVASANQAT